MAVSRETEWGAFYLVDPGREQERGTASYIIGILVSASSVAKSTLPCLLKCTFWFCFWTFCPISLIRFSFWLSTHCSDYWSCNCSKYFVSVSVGPTRYLSFLNTSNALVLRVYLRVVLPQLKNRVCWHSHRNYMKLMDFLRRVSIVTMLCFTAPNYFLSLPAPPSFFFSWPQPLHFRLLPGFMRFTLSPFCFRFPKLGN